MRAAVSGLVLGIFFVIGQSMIQVGTVLEKLDGPATATIAAVKVSFKAAKKAPKATAKGIIVTGKAIR
jgi:hypothetical protein